MAITVQKKHVFKANMNRTMRYFKTGQLKNAFTTTEYSLPSQKQLQGITPLKHYQLMATMET